MIRSNPPIPVATSTVTINRNVHDNRPILLNLSGGVTATLPKATGSGARYLFIVQTASNANVITASAAGATFTGGYVQDDSGDTQVTGSSFMSTTAGNNTFSPTTAGGGGLAGDWIEFIDYATNLYQVFGANAGVDVATNRFSTV